MAEKSVDDERGRKRAKGRGGSEHEHASHIGPNFGQTGENPVGRQSDQNSSRTQVTLTHQNF